jgi:CelD/BcsL family acetyltransferase involved in cellulose biosynthesis
MPSKEATHSRLDVLTNHLSSAIISTNDDFDKMKDAWNNLFAESRNSQPFHSFYWNYIWWQHFGKNRVLAIVIVRENDKLVGIGPFMITKRFGQHQIEPIGGVTGGPISLIIKNDREDIAELIAIQLNKTYPKGLIHIPYYTAGNYSINVFMAALITKGWSESRWVRDLSHYVYESNRFNDYMAHKSKKSRYNLKRERTQLEGNAPVELVHICHASLNEDAVERIAKIQRQSWLARRGQESLGSPFYKEVLPALAHNNNAEIFIYTQNCDDIAFILNLYSSNICYCFFIAFIETKANLSPGKMLMMDNLNQVLDRGNIAYDFLFGDAEYKRFWANRTTLLFRSTCHKGFAGWILSWFPHRLHGNLSKFDKLRKIAKKIRSIRIKKIFNKIKSIMIWSYY